MHSIVALIVGVSLYWQLLSAGISCALAWTHRCIGFIVAVALAGDGGLAIKAHRLPSLDNR